jgi:hypothetical protein
MVEIRRERASSTALAALPANMLHQRQILDREGIEGEVRRRGPDGLLLERPP